MKSAQELAASLGVNEATLRLWRAEAGIPGKARNVGYSDDEIAQIEAIAANKRKSKPRKGNDSANMPLVSAERQIYADTGADSPSVDSANDSAYIASTGANMRVLSRADVFEDAVMSRLEAIESQIAGLHALLERAAIAPRYIARQAVEDALDERPKRAVAYTKRDTRPKRGNGDVPRLSDFAVLHGVKPRTANDHARWRLIEVKNVPIEGGKEEHYVLPEQEAGIVAYWKSISYPFTVCERCPHTQEVQDFPT